MLNTISIIGLGYIGLPTATLLASRKIKVIGVDVSPVVIEKINQGKVHIVEPEMDILVQKVVNQGYLRATGTAEAADAFIITVPTPLGPDNKPDLSYIKSAAKNIAPVLSRGNIVILESTSPVGTTEQLAAWLAADRPDLVFPQLSESEPDVHIAYCPERVLPGRIVNELVENDRLIGGMTPACAIAAINLYKLFVQGKCITTHVRTAEMCKLAENSFRDINIAFANELSMICEQQGVDVWELIKLANRHPRVDILLPGCGVGGHCIAVDPWFLVDCSPEHARLIQAARRVNDSKPQWVLGKVAQAVASLQSLGLAEENIRIACLGISYKADIDDLRESPALEICKCLAVKYNGMIDVVEPNLQTLPLVLTSLQVRHVTVATAYDTANIIVLLVDHAEFRMNPPFDKKQQLIIDTRGIWSERK